MKREDFAEALGDINEKYVLEARADHRVKKPAWLKWGAIAVCMCLAAVGVWHSNIGEPILLPTEDTTIWLSADEVLKSAETGTQMGVAVPMLVAYQGAIYSFTAEEYNENSQYALLENEVTLRKNYSYPAYQVKDVSDNVAIVLNGRLEIYQKLFEVKAVIDGNPYRIVQPMMSGIDYSYGEIIQENEDFTVYQAINAQSDEVMVTEYVINVLPLLKRELPNFFDSDENYGDAWWVAMPCPNG